MKDNFLTTEDFAGRLNMECFVNIEKSITENELVETYPSDKFEILTKGQVQDFIKHLQDSVGGGIKKGGFNDTQEISDALKKGVEQVNSLIPVNISTPDGYLEVLVLKKSIDSEELQKGEISNSLEYGGDIKFEKKGSEIKGAMVHLKDNCERMMNKVDEEIMECLEGAEMMPTESFEERSYGFEGLGKMPYKMYSWNHTSFMEGMNNTTSNGESVAPMQSQEMADKHRKYNDLVYKYASLKKDMDSMNMYEKNLMDGQMYQLSPRLMMTMGF